MRLEQLEYLMEVGKYKNMTKAAEAVHISQSALSESIKRLEKELNSTLLERYHNGVSLTEAGALVVETSEQIFQQMHELKIKLAELQHDTSMEPQQIYMEVTPFFGNTYLFPYLQACQNKIERQIQTEIRDAKDIVEKVSEKQLHAGIVLLEQQTAEELEQQYPDLSFQLLRKGRLQIVLQDTNPLAQYNVIPVTEFLKHPFLFPKNGCIPAIERLKLHGAVQNYTESSIYTLPMHFIQNEQGACLISSVLLEYYNENPFDTKGLLVKDLDITIPTHLFIVMNKQFAQRGVGQQLMIFTEQYFIQT